MKSLPIMVVLPLMAVACVQWELGKGKIFYVGSSYNMLQITGDDHHDRLYQLRNIDIKPLACMANTMNTGLKIDGFPEFSREEVGRLCNIPDFCFSKQESEINESVDMETANR